MTSMAGYSTDLVMPYKPVPAPGFCQLCWKRSNVLARVTLEPSGWRTVNGKRSRTCARVVLVCNRHPGELVPHSRGQGGLRPVDQQADQLRRHLVLGARYPPRIRHDRRPGRVEEVQRFALVGVQELRPVQDYPGGKLGDAPLPVE